MRERGLSAGHGGGGGGRLGGRVGGWGGGGGGGGGARHAGQGGHKTRGSLNTWVTRHGVTYHALADGIVEPQINQ